MKAYRITEEAGICGQQTVEVYANTKEDALQIYIAHSYTMDDKPTITHNDNTTVYDFADETCTVTHVNECRVFAKWTHKAGLY